MVSPGDVAIFWDYENCHPPSSLSGYLIADRIRRIASPYGPIKLFKAYTGLDSLSPRSYALMSELQFSGVSLTYCPHNGRKDVADKMLIVDMLAFAIDHCTTTTFVLISGDGDYAYAISILRLRGYEVVVVLPSAASHMSLRTPAGIMFEWERDVLGTRLSSHSSKEASGQQESSHGAVSPEKASASNNRDIPVAFAPATPSLSHSGQPSSITKRSPLSDTNENNVDMPSRMLFPDPIRRCASTVQLLEVSIDHQTSCWDLVEEPSLLDSQLGDGESLGDDDEGDDLSQEADLFEDRLQADSQVISEISLEDMAPDITQEYTPQDVASANLIKSTYKLHKQRRQAMNDEPIQSKRVRQHFEDCVQIAKEKEWTVGHRRVIFLGVVRYILACLDHFSERATSERQKMQKLLCGDHKDVVDYDAICERLDKIIKIRRSSLNLRKQLDPKTLSVTLRNEQPLDFKEVLEELQIIANGLGDAGLAEGELRFVVEVLSRKPRTAPTEAKLGLSQ